MRKSTVSNRFFRPSAMTSNGSKPYQAAIIQAVGLATPPTLIITDLAAAREFWDRHGTVIYKSVSSVRSIVSRPAPGDTDRLRDVVTCCRSTLSATGSVSTWSATMCSQHESRQVPTTTATQPARARRSR
jgi:hypothetical protein